ncbi:IFT22, intraflagellar transport protein 22 [Monocercomonoides exilis]|uniref:IFT22, intraflagellar transport protein 22 n=1 Tax=Monocercomonoides exilis TaxID=2049356 RepID=UPI003559A7B6|nr:IFT22, intraflagellar transport protein 22 [Monocercomonoides exilis]|eukprot:MONOS_467.1-p1 / transcript=MONOS_467.1 / gene=MONOS_467 / organism=Monocercomonoides_exilis_PA203 / gene_product=IFT22, intraflagellar transport protein 22 / transcript_product=IFT22, intraflagellar transport protein 22 / location=Mono_scaffold00007:207568-208283(-) / protein_length=192 / sequence_SO=supercontig / SO=protein_coding / is_pseudo=false
MSLKIHPKIIIIGPCRTGKTNIANLIAGTSEHPSESYEKTVGVRIQEVITQTTVSAPGLGNKVYVEVWDVSGDRAFEGGWKAIQQDTDAIIFVYNAEDRSQEREMEWWYRSFAMPLSMKDSNCLVFAQHLHPFDPPMGPPTPGKAFQRIPSFHTSIEQTPDLIKSEFEKLCQNAIINALDRKEREEKRLLG